MMGRVISVMISNSKNYSLDAGLIKRSSVLVTYLVRL